MFRDLLGDSILLSKGNEEWSLRRKSISATFYKEKLFQLIKIANSVASDKLIWWI